MKLDLHKQAISWPWKELIQFTSSTDAEIGTGGDFIALSSVRTDDSEKSYDIVMGPSTMHKNDPSLADSCKTWAWNSWLWGYAVLLCIIISIGAFECNSGIIARASRLHERSECNFLPVCKCNFPRIAQKSMWSLYRQRTKVQRWEELANKNNLWPSALLLKFIVRVECPLA